MDDELEVEGAGLIPVPSPRSGVILDPETAREMQRRKTETHNEQRVRQQAVATERRREAADEVIAAVEGAIESDMTAGKSNKELADIIVQRAAKITLLAGPLFLPTSLKETTEQAKAWAAISKQYADAKVQRAADDEDTDTPVDTLAAKLKALERRATVRARERAKLRSVGNTG